MSQLYMPAAPLSQAPAAPPTRCRRLQRLLRERIVFLGTEVEDRAATSSAPNCSVGSGGPDPGRQSLHQLARGSVTAGLAIYDTMQYVPCDVSTVCMDWPLPWASSCSAPEPRGKGTPSRTRAYLCTSLRARCRAKHGYCHPGRADRLPEADDGRTHRFHTGQTMERIEKGLRP